MKKLIYIILIFITADVFGQKPSKEIIETDSSHIEIERNSDYKSYEETYKRRDSIWRSEYFIRDTTKLHTEGWKTKSGKYLGVWNVYTRKGELKYSWNYDMWICEVNKSMYPYHEMLEKMKIIADSLIISAYGKDFFDKHVKFEFDCNAYYGHLKAGIKDTFWTHDHLGTWIFPLKSKPNSFLFRYAVRLSKNDEKGIVLGIDLDSLGNYVPSKDDKWNNYGFEEVKGTEKIFLIDKNRAINTAKLHGLIVNDSSEISEFLTWENFRKQTFFNGRFVYYITDLIGKTEYTEGKERKGIIYRYNVYSFNPWTGEFIEKKKMKSIHEWGQYSGHSTGLLPDNE
jgi:hypothetical protein